jgi:hypothetical protein
MGDQIMLTGIMTLFGAMNLWWRIGSVAIVCAVIGGGIWYVHHQIYRSGYEDAEAIYKPKVAKLETDLAGAMAANARFVAENDRLAKAVTEQNLAVDGFRADALKAQDDARAAMAKVIREQASNTRNRAEIKRLEAIVNGPPLTEGDCAQADDILRSLIRDRLPERAAAPAR